MKKHLEVVGVIVVQGGKVLAARRGESKYAYVAHKYEFAGGKIEPGESAEQALAREIKEELCADIRILRPFMTLEHEYPDFTITLHTFLCEFVSDFRNTEHEALAWLPLADLNAEEWAPADASAVEKLKGMRGENF